MAVDEREGAVEEALGSGRPNARRKSWEGPNAASSTRRYSARSSSVVIGVTRGGNMGGEEGDGARMSMHLFMRGSEVTFETSMWKEDCSWKPCFS